MKNVVPYLNRSWSKHFTCWDLVREVFEKEHAIALPVYPAFIAGSVKVAAEVDDAVRRATSSQTWRETLTATEAGVVLLGRKGRQFHVGYMLSHNFVLHMPENAPSIAEPLDRVLPGYETVKFYTHAALCDRH